MTTTAATNDERRMTKDENRTTNFVWPWTDSELGHKTYYPVRPGYASTVLKFQGAELEHVTAYLDVPGAAYTAASRSQKGSDILFGGKLTAEHFKPAR